jgi:hypothetical protein
MQQIELGKEEEMPGQIAVSREKRGKGLFGRTGVEIGVRDQEPVPPAAADITR